MAAGQELLHNKQKKKEEKHDVEKPKGPGATPSHFVDYPEFEFWFSRFAQGDLDLDYDRNSDPKTRSLTDLPLEVFKNVGEYLKLHERLKLRDVCKDIRYHVDNWDHKVTEISYCKSDNWEVRETSIYYSFDSYQQHNIPSSFHQNPNSFLMNILNFPKLQVEELKIDEEDEYWEKFIRGLDESNRKLYVKKVDFLNRNRKSKMDLHFMIPGVKRSKC
ncbi:hypothetical protein GCK72_021059 [Caenorhabditis remanei]|uniref:F-box domain-containing protein n=1 Tax=Caenorhabditis remanei TaxID=31234 RepID=A0A6A5GII3_CAERE|nr:hypothetical protein GCK72_021059 [Caenorhabditis remanei]KAF1754496.1 hypothetical protein GCK72_021059 [Caenorhabditis remanei]